MSDTGFNFSKFVFVVGIFCYVASTGRFVAAVPGKICDVPTKSYCLDCLNYAVCMANLEYVVVKCPVNNACKNTSTTATCKETEATCQCGSYPDKKDDFYDKDDKWFICLDSNNASKIECKKGAIYNDVTGLCDQATIPTLPPSIPPTKPCNSKFEFMCLGCDYFQVCFSDGTESVTKCDTDKQCDANEKTCVSPPTPGCAITNIEAFFQPDSRNCSNYYYCDGFNPTPIGNYTCPSGKVFDSTTTSCTDDLSKCVEPYDCSADENDTTTTQSMTSSTPAKISTTTAPSVTCNCSPTVKACAIDCKHYNYCYEDPPGTYTPVEKTCPYDYNFNPTTEVCEPAPCVQSVKIQPSN